MALMDEQEQRRFLAALREDPAFRAEVQRELQLDQLFALPGQMADLAATVTGLTAAVNGLVDHAAQTQRELSSLFEEHARTRADLDALIQMTAQGFDTMRDGFAEIRDGFAEIRDGFAAMRGGLLGLQSEMRDGFAEMRNGLLAVQAGVEARLDQVDSEIRDIKGDVRDIKGRLAS